ncbi:MAG: hypothetical protein LBB50_04770 [Oscillospiraceae bacterium]|jgi:hypothetical protein|nr:hypothetical protein [Oscillospiraceae bacterium]
MEAFIKDQIVATLKHVPFHTAASYCKPKTSPEAEACRKKVGGFIKGICHPNEDCEQIRGAGIRWTREDIPFPFDKTGAIREDYLHWKEKQKRYRAGKVRVMAVTPYPHDFIEHGGIDPRLPENEARVREIAAFFIHDLKDIVEAIQITNEMGVPRFTLPLTMDEAARFIGVQLAAMHPHRGDIIIGYNSAGPQSDLHAKMRPWLQYCDYVGIDIYIGCFVSAGSWLQMFDLLLRYLWSMTGKPIILTEFGYISGGAPKSPAEKRAVLERYGVRSEAEAREKIDMVMDNIHLQNQKMWDYITHNASGSYADFLFQLDFRNHFYSLMPEHTLIKGYPHTPHGQADFYRDLLPRLAKLPFLVGAFVYCYADSDKCYVCGQDDCPTETRWGLVTCDHKEKPAYFAVRDAFSRIN